MRIELLSDLATDASQKGDHFQARVVEPKEYEGAIINGRVVSVKRPGRVKSTAQLQLSFDEIRFSDGRSARMSAQVIEVIPGGGSQGAGKSIPKGACRGPVQPNRMLKRSAPRLVSARSSERSLAVELGPRLARP